MSETTQYASQAMENGTRPYEISFLVRSEGDVEGVASLLAAHGAQVTDEGQVRKLALAYPIKHVKDGYFGYLKAAMTAEGAKALENAARTDKSVLRLLILSDEPAKEPKEAAPKKPARRPRAEKPAAAATNEDLEKAIAEIGG